MSGENTAIDSQARPGETCWVHQGRPADHTCVDCGRSFCPECGRNWEGDFICRFCLRAYRVSNRQVDETVQEEGPPGPLSHAPSSPAFLLRILFRPGRFFENMPSGRGLGEPFFFALLWGLIIFLLAVPSTWITMFFLAGQANLMRGVLSDELIAEIGSQSWQSLILTVPGTVMLFLLFKLVQAVLQHGLLVAMVRSARFELTLRVVLYSVAAQALCILPIPILAILAAEIYGTIMCAIGFRKVHRLGVGPAVMVALFPFVLLTMVVFLRTALGGM